MLKIWPSCKQFKNWSMPNKYTFIGTIVGVFAFIFAVATYFLSEEIRIENSFSLEGQVFDASTNSPLIRAQVSIKTKQGLAGSSNKFTDELGHYSIPVIKGDILIFKKDYYQSKEKEISSDKPVSVYLTPKSTM